jgi:glutamate 5-kinase
MSKRELLKGCRRVVIKVGTSTLTHSNGQLNLRRIESLVREIADLHNQDIEVLVVSSGAIGVGLTAWGIKRFPKPFPKSRLWRQ